MYIVECLVDDQIVDYDLFWTLTDANSFLMSKSKELESTDLDLEKGTVSFEGIVWVRHPVEVRGG